MIQDNFKIIKDYMKLIEEKKSYVIGLFLFSILGHLSDLLLPVGASQIIEMVSIKAYDQAFLWAFLLAFFYILYNTAWYFNYRFYAANYTYIHSNLQSRLLNKVSTLDDEFYSKISKGKILNTNATDLENLSDLIDIICEFLIVAIKLIIIAIIFLHTNIYIGLFVILLNIFYINILDINNKQGAVHLEGTKKYVDKITDTLSETLEGLHDVQAYNLMPKLNNKFDLYEKKWREQYNLKHKYSTRKETILPNIIDLGKVVLYALLIILVIRGRIAVDALILLISYYELLTENARDLMDYSKTMRDNHISIKRFTSILNYTENKKINFGTNDNDYIYGSIEFKHVHFSYKEKQVFKNLNLKIKANQITSFLGYNGSGKTTINKLLLRQAKVDKGIILIDGVNIYDYNPEIYHNNVTSVNTNSYTFNMSIKANLSLVDPNVKNQIAVCKRVGIHHLIMSLPKGYNTILSENSNNLSEEQKLLIAIARSLLTKAEIIIFDEVTNVLEKTKIEKFIELCNNLKLDHTIILLTKDKKIAKIADQIYMLENGKVVAEGTNKEISQNEYYKQFNKQKGTKSKNK